MIVLSVASIGLSIYESNIGALLGWGCTLILTILGIDNKY